MTTNRSSEAQQLARDLLELAAAGRWDETSELAYQVWESNPPLLSSAMFIWFFMVQESHGKEAVTKGVEIITEQMYRAPVDSPLSRGTFCNIVYALEDNAPDRAHRAWTRLLDADDWLAANEVVGLMLSFVGYYLGWFGQEGFLYE